MAWEDNRNRLCEMYAEAQLAGLTGDVSARDRLRLIAEELTAVDEDRRAERALSERPTPALDRLFNRALRRGIEEGWI